jgi:hypothetical protein
MACACIYGAKDIPTDLAFTESSDDRVYGAKDIHTAQPCLSVQLCLQGLNDSSGADAVLSQHC